MPEVRRPVPADDLCGHLQARQRVTLGGVDVEGRGIHAGHHVHIEVDERAGEELHGREALVEVARRHQAIEQRLGDRLAGLVMDGEPRQDRRLSEPVLVDLRRQLHEIGRHGGAGDTREGDIRQQAVQRVAELVEQGLRVVVGQKCRLARGGLVEIADVQHDRSTHTAELALVAEAAHPRARLLRGAREEITVEETDQATVALTDLPDAHIRVIDRQVLAGRELQAPELVGDEELRLQHLVELEVGLELVLVEIEARLADLLGVVAPVPALQLEPAALGVDQRLHVGAFLEGALARRLPDALDQVARRRRRLRHAVGEHEVRMGREAEQLGAFGAQRHHLADDLAVVPLVAVGTTGGPGLEGLLAQRAVVAELQEGLDRGAGQRDEVLALLPGVLAGLQCGFKREGGQPRAIGIGLQFEAERVRVGQLVLLELHGQHRHALVDLADALLLLRVELRTGADEVLMVLLDDPPLFRRQRRAVVIDRLDAREQRGIEIDIVAQRGELRAHLALDALDVGVGVRRGPVREHRLHTAQHLTAGLQALEGVGEGRRGALRGDRLDLGAALGDAGVERRHEVRFLDQVERRGAIRQRPGLQERVARGVGERDTGGGDGDHGGRTCGSEEITTIHGTLRTKKGEGPDGK